MDNIQVIFFDLFFTLITPDYANGENENDVLELTHEEWEIYAEDNELYRKRATGKVKTVEEIISDIINKIPKSINQFQKEEILRLRMLRMKNAMINVNSKVLEVLKILKSSGKKLCLISNADMIDAMYWKDSELATYFDNAIFSYEIGCLKPNYKIYKIAMDSMNVISSQCLFVGDGGSDELKGAREAGMKTLFTEYLEKKDIGRREKILQYADYCISDFLEISQILCAKRVDSLVNAQTDISKYSKSESY
jgi:putative hydrolase of the HAD superfamily